MCVLPDVAPRGPYSGRTVLHLVRQILLQTPRADHLPGQRPQPREQQRGGAKDAVKADINLQL